MRSYVKFSYVIFCFFYSMTIVFAKEMVYVGTEKIPQELDFLIKSLQTHFKIPGENSFNIISLNNCFESILEKDVVSLSKTIIYKTILAEFRNYKTDTLLDKKGLESLNETIQNKKPFFEFFSLWFLNSLQNDIEEIKNHPQYEILVKRVNSKNPLLLKELAFLKKKMDLVFPWYEQFAKFSPEEINIKLKTLALNIYNNLLSSCYAFQSFASFQDKKLKKVDDDKTTNNSNDDSVPEIQSQFFILKDISEERAKELFILNQLPSPVDDFIFEIIILDELENKEAKPALPDPINDWNY